MTSCSRICSGIYVCIFFIGICSFTLKHQIDEPFTASFITAVILLSISLIALCRNIYLLRRGIQSDNHIETSGGNSGINTDTTSRHNATISRVSVTSTNQDLEHGTRHKNRRENRREFLLQNVIVKVCIYLVAFTNVIYYTCIAYFRILFLCFTNIRI